MPVVAPFATRAEPWQSSTASAYGKALEGEGVVAKHKEDLQTAFTYIRWGGLAPTTSVSSKSGGLQEESTRRVFEAIAPFTNQARQEDAAEGMGSVGNIGYGSGLYAQASRGKISGTQRKWCFERMPSLLPQPLLRGQISCGVAPPCSAAQWPQATCMRLPRDTSEMMLSSTGCPVKLPLHMKETALAAPLSRVRSEPNITRSTLTLKDSRRPAGDVYRGASGEFLGF